MYQVRDRFVAPFKPTPPAVLRLVGKLVEQLLRNILRQPVIYEAGCGLAAISRHLAQRVKAYAVCVEIDDNIAVQAKTISNRLLYLIDVIIGDITSFRLRRVDIVYTYLVEEPMKIIEQLVPKDALLITLDYPAPSMRIIEAYEVAGHILYLQSWS